jgi:hypothetical protein
MPIPYGRVDFFKARSWFKPMNIYFPYTPIQGLSIGIFHTLLSFLLPPPMSSLIDLADPYIVAPYHSSPMPLVVSVEHVQTISINVGQAFL